MINIFLMPELFTRNPGNEAIITPEFETQSKKLLEGNGIETEWSKATFVNVGALYRSEDPETEDALLIDEVYTTDGIRRKCLSSNWYLPYEMIKDLKEGDKKTIKFPVYVMTEDGDYTDDVELVDVEICAKNVGYYGDLKFEERIAMIKL